MNFIQKVFGKNIDYLKKQRAYANYIYRITPVFWNDGTSSYHLDSIKPEHRVSFKEFDPAVSYTIPSDFYTIVAASSASRPYRNGNTIMVGLEDSQKIGMLEEYVKKSKDFYAKILLAQEKRDIRKKQKSK
jgi:hypothetical protein